MFQSLIEDDDLESLQIGRRQLSTEWKDVVKPRQAGGNFCLLLPFKETYENSFKAAYSGPFFARQASGDRLQIWLNETENETEVPTEAEDRINSVRQYVAIRDLLVVSFALDYTHIGGDPERPLSAVGELRQAAKPYAGKQPLCMRRRC